MAGRSIIIYSDGTGQAGGITFDEDRSNIYKLYRATRVAPDSSINPAEQMAFYDPGLGSVADGGHMVGRFGRRIYNVISQATGLGVTANIIDGYAALIRLWQPGDQIYLFGFSRGAYTVRCLASVIGFCGVPTRERDGSALKHDYASSRRLASHAVKNIYQYTHSKRPDVATPRETELMEQRSLLAKRFRTECASADLTDDKKANVYPHFIGVFDTVAAIASPGSMMLLLIAYALLAIVVAFAIEWLPYYLPGLAAIWPFRWLLSFNVWWMALVLAIAGPVIAAIVYILKSVQWATGLENHSFWRTLHLTQLKQKFRDLDLNENVGYARHAISIDENRKDFQRVRWGFRDHKHASRDAAGNYWFQQVWFAGNHADIGGSYIENESRLSDHALKWMTDEAVKFGLKIDPSVLHLYPSHDGMQHDEVAAGFPFLTRWTGKTWAMELRKIPTPKTTVHESVYKRFEAGKVIQYDVACPYRPPTLSGHDDFKQYYPSATMPPSPTVTEDATVPAPTQEQPDPEPPQPGTS